jgi:hypothetical protein
LFGEEHPTRREAARGGAASEVGAGNRMRR